MRRKIICAAILLLICNLACAEDGVLDKKLKRREPYTGKRFHEGTKMIWGQVWKTRSILTDKEPPAPYKDYPQAKKIKLPLLNYSGKQVEAAEIEALPNGNFSSEAISLEELSQILFSADGIIKKEEKIDLRTAPVPLPQTRSFSYMHPIEIYVLVKQVSGLRNGLYHYSFIGHSLEFINEKLKDMPNCCFEQPVLDNSAAAIILTGIPARLTWAYDTRSYRYIYMTAGAVSQNIYLECASLGLGSTATASFHDDSYNQFLGIDGENEVTLILHLIGRIKR